MQDLGISVLFQGTNFLRLLGGLWITIRISLISAGLSIVFGVILGMIMTMKNPVVKAICRVYLEFIRIMPQLVLLFLVYFGLTRAFGWNLSGTASAILSLPCGVPRSWAIWCAAHCKAFRSISTTALKLWA